MGVSGLLPLLKSIQRPTELKKFSGQVLGVDGYGWLHRGAIACAIDLALGKPTRKYVDYAMHRVNMMKYFGVTPYIVLDGDFLPSKAGTEASREKRREASKKTGMELFKAGKQTQAFTELQKAIDVTPEMARHFIEALKSAGVQYVVAPYEADAQLVYLERQGLINGIISEDSDILVFGAKRLLTKLGQHGECIEINRKDFCAVREVCLTGWTDAEFRHMAIFSGCDYLEGISNVGLKTAHRMIRKCKTPERVIKMLQFDGKHKISENYLASFKQAELTFIYQRVFCPKKQDIVFLTEPDSTLDLENMPFIGAHVDTHLARAIAAGDINPITKEPIILPPMAGKRRIGEPAGLSSPTATAPGPKKPAGKPIDSYFKGPHRIPLGEMDPNCFVVEPAQVASLTQHGLLPRVFPLPRPYIQDQTAPTSATSRITAASRPTRSLRRQTEPISSLLDLGDASTHSESRRRTTGPSLPECQEASPFTRPPKKARLCEDLSPDDSAPQATPERSKFFPPSSTKSSYKKTDLILLSDDSVEEALLSLPDITEWHSTKARRTSKKIQVFEESPSVERRMDSEVQNAASDNITTDEDVEVPVSSLPALSDIDASEVKEPLKTSLRQFSYTPQVSKPGSQGATRMVYGLPTPASSIQSSQKAESSGSSAPPSSRPAMVTPLQRLGANAMRPNRPTPPTTPKESKPGKGKRLSFKSHPVNPAFVPLPKVDMAEVEALNRPLGSEDQIIPDSDDENELDSGETGEGPMPKSNRLDLSRFLFT
ncbi:hypothetical protein GQ53DRAFT_843538 [Thozetella sp. PMI_491]|nr:hypothetical protein GQ53DRAFT_843538 [Thozetella sp. PMI_491]